MDIKNDYVYFNGKKLRYGYTTGSSATAATKAALTVLLDNSKKNMEKIEIKVPAGQILKINVKNIV